MAEFDIDGDLIRKLADLLSETGLTEVEFAEGDRRIRVTRQGRAVAAEVSAPAAPAAAPAPAAGPAAGAVPSPMVGTAYLSPEPGAPAFVKVGDQITEGQTLMIVEAMKVMNPIRAPRSGRVKQILVSDSQPVEFGETLMVVE